MFRKAKMRPGVLRCSERLSWTELAEAKLNCAEMG